MPSRHFFITFFKMARTRKYKEQLVQSYRDSLAKNKYAFIVKPSGVTANESVQLKKDLNGVGSNYNIIKNSIFSIALEQEGLPAVEALKQEEHAVIFTDENATEAAKIIEKFAEETEKVEIQGGIYEGRYITGEEVISLAKLPSKEVLIAQALSMFNSPITGLLNVINANSRNLVYVLKAMADQKTA